jgi:hypothetical protein
MLRIGRQGRGNSGNPEILRILLQTKVASGRSLKNSRHEAELRLGFGLASTTLCQQLSRQLSYRPRLSIYIPPLFPIYTKTGNT